MIFFLVLTRNLHVSGARTKSHTAKGLGSKLDIFGQLHQEGFVICLI